MLVLDENLPAGQRQLLRSWRVRFRTVGREVAFFGAKDENLIPLLHRLANPTFFSLDRDFYRQEAANRSYCLVWLDVRAGEAGKFIRAFLRHPEFRTHAKRKGVVARVYPGGVQFWRMKTRSSVSWPRPVERST
jgi:hypothetical protein